ncbi:ThiF family adenylyltransferase [Pseudomonas baetica]|uniref:ThiF family adenylyltransferase n=1 Tax=Pseudomonas baetica TaxID=674054 RepID=UPI002406A012|nr:ThiF family adenylyltransferase [Pseudomonas baetica]MDF9779158.1 PRTRC genetic system ThiF family protein [Pseudomonas baetica]
MIAQLESNEVRFTAPERWLDQAINVVVLGAGGNGSEVVDCLATFHFTLLKLGHPRGLNVTVIDDAVVRESNLVRQRFWPCDIDQYKSICLVNRYNLNLGNPVEGTALSFPR